jgi:hypothetical protein
MSNLEANTTISSVQLLGWAQVSSQSAEPLVNMQTYAIGFVNAFRVEENTEKTPSALS